MITTAGRLSSAFVLMVAILFGTPSLAADIAVNAGCTLADAIAAANTDESVGGCQAGEGADVVTLSADITLEAELPRINTEITVEGGGFSISGALAHRVFYVEVSGNLSIEQLTLVDGRSGPENAPGLWSGKGGAIYNEGKLNITDSVFSQNEAGMGGAISNRGVTSVNGSKFLENSAYAGPGAIENLAGAKLNVRESQFLKNDGHAGGAIANLGSLLLTDSLLELNRADFGGAIHSTGVSIIQRSNITFNFAEDGGAIINFGEQTIVDSLVIRNFTVQDGGAVINSDKLNIVRSVFKGNIAGAGGHTVASGESTETHRNYHPYVTGVGGAVYNREEGDLIVSESSFTENAAGVGGAIFNIGALMVTSSAFSGNGADKVGGALYSRGLLSIRNSSFIGNSATEGGGLVLPGSEVYASESALTHLTILGNSAEIGGGVHVESSSHAPVNVHNSILADNVGGDCAGGLSHSQGNFIKDGSCDAEISGDPMVGDLVQPEDGSPPYYPLLPGSPAIDVAMSDHCPDSDQIGTARPQGVGCDIGAIEYVPEE